MNGNDKHRSTNESVYTINWDKIYNEEYQTDEELIIRMKLEARYGFRDSDDYYDEEGNFIDFE